MADTKISALPASTTPLAGTEVLPIVQGGTTNQVSVANLTAGRAISATEMTLTTGNLIVANGQGIDFSATSHPAGMTSEVLDDYEVGTFTPTVVGSTTAGTATYGGQTGRYTKIGNRVLFSIALDYSSHTGTGDMRISGLPFTAVGNDVVTLFAANLTYTGTHLQPFLVSTQIWMNQTTSGGSDTYIPMDAACQLQITGQYRTS